VRIAFISANKGLPWGGSEELWVAAGRRAIEAGHEVCACVFDWPEPARQVLELEKLGATVVRIPLRSKSRIPLLPPRHPWMKELAAFKPEMVCVNQGQEYDFAGRRWGKTVLEWLKKTKTPAASVSQYNDDEFKLGSKHAAIARDFIKYVRLNAYVAQRNIEQTERQLGIGVPHSVVVRNPVNLKDTSPLAWPTGEKARFSCVARLHTAAKAQDLLLAALGRAAWRERHWKLALWGVGPDERTFRQMAAALGIAERVEFKGFARDMREVWAENQVLVLSSRGEGTPLAQVEAMLLGRPCVVTDVGDCAAWVREGKDGWVARDVNVDAIDGALERAWAARGKWEQMGAAAAAHARELFDADAGGTLLGLLVEAAK
jgi:glycosyltransferase involved in cell wall biosynthesis